MSLSEKDKAIVKATWNKISKRVDEIGVDALGRMLQVFPQTKTYFSHWPDLSYGSASVVAHSKKVMTGIATAVAKIDDLNLGLLDLSETHAYKLRVDPSNFKLLSFCILVAVAVRFPKEFTPEVHLTMDKFLAAVAFGLSERYR